MNSSSAYRSFTAKLREARETAGLTQVQLAKRLGKPQSYVSKYEKGERRLDVIELLAVLRGLKISPLEFIEDLIS